MKYDEFISVIASDVGRILEENTANIAKDLIGEYSTRSALYLTGTPANYQKCM